MDFMYVLKHMFIDIHNRKRYDFDMKVTKLAVRIRQLREAKGLSQVELSRLSEVDQGLLSRLEDGIGNPSLKTLGAIAKGLGVSVSDLTQGA